MDNTGKKLHIRIAQMLNDQIPDSYLKNMKLHSRTYLEPAIWCKCTSPSDIFDNLERKGLIRFGNYEILKDLLKEADLVNVLKMVEAMEKDILPYTKPATSYEPIAESRRFSEQRYRYIFKIIKDSTVSVNWLDLGRELCLSEVDLIRIKNDNQGNLKEQCYQTLLNWQQQCKTPETLIQALTTIGHKGTAEKIQDYLKEST